VKNQFKAFQSGLKRGTEAGKSRVALGIVALFLSLALLSGCFRDPNVRKHKYLESGERYSAQGKDREAAIQFSNALKIDKNFADAHYALAKTDLHMGAFSAAYGELLRTVDLQPANYKARLELGDMLLAGGKVDAAQTQADATVAAEPNNADAHALLARIAAKRGQKDQALSEIHRALELNPNNAEYHDTLALLEVGEPAQDSQPEVVECQTAAVRFLCQDRPPGGGREDRLGCRRHGSQEPRRQGQCGPRHSRGRGSGQSRESAPPGFGRFCG
jgi:Tfp pilus assembly protein PilF